ncbi:MAG: alpha/beta hydrolase [Flavobacteriia bacterium]|nr:alpha/beta hydrolase [Flavobacteriia bacterium]
MNNPSTTLHYRISGNGDPVVFLHGFMEDSSMWDEIILHFQHKTCILIDLHGHGNSFFDPELPREISVMAQQVRSTLDHLSISTYQLVGHSLGGYVGCELLKTDPLLEHLLLFHSHPWPDSPAKKIDRDRVSQLVLTKSVFLIREAIPNLFAFPAEHPEAIKTYCNIAEQMNPEAIAWSTIAMRNRGSSEQLLADRAENVSIIQGQLDPLIPNLQLRSFAEKHRIGFYEITRCGHMGQVEAPTESVELLTAILG